MQKPNDYLKRYADRYRVSRSEDGIWNIKTRHKARDGISYEVYDYNDSHLAALLSPRAGRSLLKRFSDVFTLHQDAADGKVLLFEEKHLDELADALKLRRRRRVSETERRRLADLSQKHSQEGLRKIAEVKRVLSGDSQGASESHNLPKPISDYPCHRFLMQPDL